MKNFFYYVSQNNFTISDLAYCTKSKNSFDIDFFDFALSEELLGAFKFLSIHLNRNRTKKESINMFAGYLTSFTNDPEDLKFKKLLTNPKLRILIQDEELKIKLSSFFEKEKIQKLKENITCFGD